MSADPLTRFEVGDKIDDLRASTLNAWNEAAAVYLRVVYYRSDFALLGIGQ